MTKLFALEGVDASGKTSIAKKLAETTGGVHYYSPPKCLRPLREQVRGLGGEANLHYYMLGNHIATAEVEELLEEANVFAEPWVYSTIAGHSVSLGREIAIPEGVLLPERIVHVTASWEEIEKRLAERGEQRKAHENVPYLKRVAEKYDALLSDRDDVITIDTTGRDVGDVVSELLPKLRL